MFRTNPLGGLLASALLVLALLTCWLSVRYFFVTRKLYAINERFQLLQGTLNGVQAIANECVLYSQRDASIDPLLEEFGVKPKPRSPAAPTPKPAR